MGEHIKLTAEDGHTFDAYVARPAGKPIGGLVVVQEIFGVNAHMRAVTDGFAQDGFLAVAPALFDRMERDLELDYGPEGMQKAMSLAPKFDMEAAVLDVGAALTYAADESGGKAGVVGYCLGGSLAWLAATRLPAAAAVGYYGGRIAQYASETPHAPVMLHFGKDDAHIPPSSVEKVTTAHPAVQVFWYEHAGHAFNRDIGPGYNPDAARVARQRSLDFLTTHLAGERSL